MCGIAGMVGGSDIGRSILDLLTDMSYRGYDSAGIAWLNDSAGNIECVKAPGKIENLIDKFAAKNLSGSIGIGHTRWATHGLVSEDNAQPHVTPIVAVVHNGIVENFKHIRNKLAHAGVNFISDTDSEVIPQLITYYVKQCGLSHQEALRKTMCELEGAISIVAMFAGSDTLIAAKKDTTTSLVLGYGHNGTIVASDVGAISRLARNVSFLQNNDIAVITRHGVTITDYNNVPVERQMEEVEFVEQNAQKGQFAHFMLKEIFEQPNTLSRTVQLYTNRDLFMSEYGNTDIDSMAREILNSRFVRFIGCGSASYACQIGKWYMENVAQVRAAVDVASEFRYGGTFVSPGDTTVFVSQSGETADAIAALHYVKHAGNRTIGVVNVPYSYLARNVDCFLPTLAGPEISVATTKAFTAQLAVMYFLAASVARVKGLSVEHDFEIAGKIAQFLESDEQKKICDVVPLLGNAASSIYIGRGANYSVALEGALKLREIAYIHAEAIAAGELKHGSIALIDSRIPVVAICPSDETFRKTLSSIQEIKARAGMVLVVTDETGADMMRHDLGICDGIITVPNSNRFVAPVLFSVVMQLLAYYVAVFRGTDIDRPRNLAKSVTVE